MWVSAYCTDESVKLKWPTTLTPLSLSLDDAEASGDGHKADEDVCVGGAERVETGAPAAEPA